MCWKYVLVSRTSLWSSSNRDTRKLLHPDKILQTFKKKLEAAKTHLLLVIKVGGSHSQKVWNRIWLVNGLLRSLWDFSVVSKASFKFSAMTADPETFHFYVAPFDLLNDVWRWMCKRKDAFLIVSHFQKHHTVSSVLAELLLQCFLHFSFIFHSVCL